MDWKKEIKLSDFFKRGGKATREAPREQAEDPNPSADRTSFLKKDVKLSFRRREEEARAPKAPKAPKGEKKPKAPKRRRGANPAAPLPTIPLMRAFNLLPKDDPRQARGRRPSTAQLVLAVAALVVIAGMGTAFLLLSARVADKEQTYNDLRARLAALKVRSDEPEKPVDSGDQKLVDERNSRTSALATALGGRVAWDRLLRDVSLVLPEDVWLTTMTAKSPTAGSTTAAPSGGQPPTAGTTAGANSFTITGYTYGQNGVAQLLSRLAVIPELSGVQLASSVRADVGGREVVQFTINAAVNPGGGAAA